MDTQNTKSPQSPDCLVKNRFKLYRRRYWMLFLFTCFSVWLGIMYPEYSTMANVTGCFYGVSQSAVSWTESASNLIYALLVFPATTLVEKLGLKWMLVIGVFSNVIASSLQFATLAPGSFGFVLLSIVFSSFSAVTVLGTPPVLASRWFPDHEQSRACAVGVAGYQFGMSVGSLFPLAMSNDCSKPELIAMGKFDVSVILTTGNVIFFLLFLISFQNRPPSPPSQHQAVIETYTYSPTLILQMFRNKDFLVIIIANGIFVGVFCALLSTLNNLMLRYFPSSEVHIGWMGFLFSNAGIIEAFVTGYIIDRTHKYKELSMAVAVGCFSFYVLFICLLNVNIMWLQYVTVFLLGLFASGTLPLGYEYSLEVTYPQSEITCSNIFTATGLLLAVVFTQLSTLILDNWGPEFYSLFLSFPLACACFITCLYTTDYKRFNSNTIEGS